MSEWTNMQTAVAVALGIGFLGSPALADGASLELWPADCLTKVMRDAQPPKGPRVVRVGAARGEIASAQAVCWSSEPLDRVSCKLEELRHRSSDATISSGAIRLQWVRYIDVRRNTGGIPADELVATAPTSIPDPFWEDDAISLPAQQAQPLWIEIDVPRAASPGDYVGTLQVTNGGKRASLFVELHVWSFELPEERHLSIINWWRFPGPGFEDRVQPFSEEYWRLLGQFCKFLVAHRQTDVNASLGLVREVGTPQDGFSYDTSRLEHFAEVAFGAGIRRIHLHRVGRRADRQGVAMVPREPAIRRLAAFEKRIDQRGWQGRFLVSICDEPRPQNEESYARLVDLVRQTVPTIPCVEAVLTEFPPALDICVPNLIHLDSCYPRFDELRRKGAELWFYTCCIPTGRYPNRFLDQSLVKVRVLHWTNYLYQLKGYLHWGLNMFAGSNPYSEEGISKNLPLGDRAIVYPGRDGLVGSIRFSAQRDGIQDFEYLWVLENRLRQVKVRCGEDAFWLDPRQRPLELCRRVVWSCRDHTRGSGMLLRTRRALAEEIESLSAERFLIVQTSPPEGTFLPAGPRRVIVRGLAPAGASVTVNGADVRDVRPSGYFVFTQFLGDDADTIAVRAAGTGYTLETQRRFRLTPRLPDDARVGEAEGCLVTEAGKAVIKFKTNQGNATVWVKFQKDYTRPPLVIVSEWNSSGTFVILKAERVSKEKCAITGHRIDVSPATYECQVAYLVIGELR